MGDGSREEEGVESAYLSFGSGIIMILHDLILSLSRLRVFAGLSLLGWEAEGRAKAGKALGS